jgi:hypothetical protein
MATALLMPAGFLNYLLTYVVLTLSYSLWIKRKLLVDVLALALLYTIRILAGGAAIKVAVSEWLLMFSLFLFLSLAFLKRAIELQGSNKQISGRGYSYIDLDMVRTIGVSAGMMSVMVMIDIYQWSCREFDVHRANSEARSSKSQRKLVQARSKQQERQTTRFLPDRASEIMPRWAPAGLNI